MSRGGLTLHDYLRVLWRWKWMIVIAVCASALAAYVYSAWQPPQYLATASIIYVQPVDPANPLMAASTTDARDLAVEQVVNVIESPPVVEQAGEILGRAVTDDHEISTEVRGGPVDGMGGVVDVSATGEDAREAAAVANAYAKAIVEWSKLQQLERIAVAERAIETRLEDFTTDESRLTTDYIMLKQELQNLQLLQMTVTGDFQLIVEAIPPEDPFAPRPLQAAGLGIGVGLLAGVGMALLLNQLTTRVRGRHEVGQLLGLPVVGTLPKIERRILQEGGLIALTHPDGAAAEALRLLRSNLDYLNIDDATSLLVTSALAGEGKSLTASNLAVTMAMAGKRVVVADGDLRRPRLHEYFELPNDVGLSSVAAGDVALEDALVRVDLSPALRANGRGSSAAVEEGAGAARVRVAGVTLQAKPHIDLRIGADRELMVLTAGPLISEPGELAASRRFGEIIRELQGSGYDFVIVDAPPLLEVGDAAAMAAEIEALVLIVDQHKARQETLAETRHLLAPLPCKKLGVILVKASEQSRYGNYYSV